MSNQPKNIKASDFKDRFDQESNNDLGWNNPPDFLFEDAINSINNQNKKKRKSILFILLAGFVLTGVMINQYYFSNRIENLESQVEKISAVESTKSEVSSAGTLSADQTIIDTEQVIVAKKAEESVTSKSLAKEKTTSIMVGSEKEADLLDNFSVEKRKSRSALISEKNQLKKQSVITTPRVTESNKEEITLLSAIPTLSFITRASVSILLMDDNSRQIVLDRTPDIKASTPVSKLQSRIGLRLERNISTLRMTAPLGTQDLTLYDNYYSGVGVHLDYVLPISSKLELVSSVSYRKISNESLAESTLAYQKGIEVDMPGEMAIYEMDNEIESPLGTLEERMQLFVDPSLTKEGDMLQQSISLDQCVSIIGLSSGFSYKLLDTQKFTWAASAQPSLNIILGMESNMHSQYEMHDVLMGESESKLVEAANTRKLYGSLNLSSSFSYKLSNDFQLSFGLGYQRGMSSLRKDMNNSSGTYLNSWTTNVGISKSF